MIHGTNFVLSAHDKFTCIEDTDRNFTSLKSTQQTAPTR